jgi:hypothetical protein
MFLVVGCSEQLLIQHFDSVRVERDLARRRIPVKRHHRKKEKRIDEGDFVQ